MADNAAHLPPLTSAYAIIAASLCLLVVGGYAVLFSSFLPNTGVAVLDAMADDTHYKYFAVLVIPMGVYFVIANWVGWQYFQNS